MDIGLKQRLVGATVLISLAVIFLPILLNGGDPSLGRITLTEIPPKPKENFASRVIPLAKPDAIQPARPGLEPVPETRRPQVKTAQSGADAAQQTPARKAGKDHPGNGKQIQPESKEAPTRNSNRVRVGLVAWIVQVGSFTTQENADKLRDRLHKQGYASFIEQTYADDGKRFRVRIGPELDRGNAEAIQKKLEKTAAIKGIILRYP